MLEPDDDVLGRVLERTQLRGQVYCSTAARAPWGLRFQQADKAMFHIVTDGACWLVLGDDRRQLASGDIVLFPRGSAHALADHPSTRRVALEDWLAQPRVPGGALTLGGTIGTPARVICGSYTFDTPAPRNPVLRLLPDTLHLRGEANRARPDLAATIAALAREHARTRSGMSLVISRLLDVLFVQIVRAWADDQPSGGAGWIGALHDSTLARALALLHGDLARAWDVEGLARAAGTSRATLGRRFVAEVGEPPLSYLARLRLQEAARRLERSDASIATIAHAVGYTSEFAFNRAFRRELGAPPGAYRRAAQA
ncbi:MAG: AraC family transcriptional regulator [Kofleriaceae bacterium]